MINIDIKEIKKEKSIKELLEFGIIILDKPSGFTSFEVSDHVKKLLNLKKTSHFGTLDPMVTGVLPIALGRACKLTGFFLGEDKEYEGIMHIHEDISIEEIKKAINEKFVGKIKQLPPVRSSVKRQEREREIKKFELIEKNNKDISFRVECQGGTYIRKLIHDLGEEIKIGAHMTKLKRIRAGIFTDKNMISKEKLERAVEEYKKGNEENLKDIIIPAEIISKVYPVLEIKKEDVDRVLHGAPIKEEMIFNKKENYNEEENKNNIICVFNERKFIGMFKIVNKKEAFALPLFVFQEIR
ncbi:RNA-guided pseudouridylation complex pseudouridine synthase subunit Cbf5 [Candidatus Woesearchaeota archaeon]|jgi:H/ACA ribonucleoprotein complex subunit 4|nr:RNA-guided pseudouridylation complex pseudouridine synthase subunit Cbf5 [Candidatus Woesearchaeota archaeon]